MENPYQTPDSNLEERQGFDPSFQRAVFWKIYYYIFITIVAFGLLSLLSPQTLGIVISQPGESVLKLNEVLNLVVNAIAIYCMTGFVFLKAFLRRWVWQAWFFILLAADAFYMYFTALELSVWKKVFTIRADDGTTIELVGLIIGVIIFMMVVISLPLYIATYLYAFRSNEIWNRQNQ